jgi:hypothetical protein
VEDIDPLDVVEVNRSTTSSASSSSSSSSSAGTTTTTLTNQEDGKVDPFATWAWQRKDRIEKNNATITEYLERGGTYYRQTWLFNATWSGFGPILRPKMWAVRMQFCVAQRVDLRKIVEHRGVPYTVYGDIMKDVERTYSQLERQPPPHLSPRHQPEKIYQLLLAMAAYNPSIGYAQGMNRVAMVLVDVFDAPWEQLWAFDYILNKVAPHYFSHNAIGQNVDADLASFYIRRLDVELADALAAHDKRQGCLPNFVITNLTNTWFGSLFISCMRYENLLRLWDGIIMDGPTVMFEFLYRCLQANRHLFIPSTVVKKEDANHQQPLSEAPDLIVELNRWLKELPSLDSVLEIKVKLPIALSDLEARRASHLHAILMARQGDTNYSERLSTQTIPNYNNMGRGCLCATATPSTTATQNRSSLMSTTRPLAEPLRALSASPRRTTSSGTNVASSNNTIGSTNALSSNGHVTRSAARDLGGRAQSKRNSLPAEMD